MNQNSIHACCIILGSNGVLIRGISGSGKSRLAHILIENWENTHGFARWVSDDRVTIDPHPNAIIARVPAPLKGKAERRFGGIENISNEDAARLDLIVDLVREEKLSRLPVGKAEHLDKSSPPIPVIHVPENNPDMAAELVASRIQLLDKTAHETENHRPIG